MYPSSNSSLTPNISSGLSTQITVKVRNTVVGVIQSLTVSQNRDIHILEEVGNEGIIESFPKNAAKIELDVKRVVFDDLRILEAFARGYVNLQSQRVPFNIDIIDMTSYSDKNYIVHICHNCWFKSSSITYVSNDYIISEQAKLTCEYITSMRDCRNVSNGGIRNITYEYDTIERNTDLLGKRGSFFPSCISK